MGTPATQLRVSEEANQALKDVAARFPEWSLAQLAQKLLVEACRAVTSEQPVPLPTVDYLRAQLGKAPLAAMARGGALGYADAFSPLVGELQLLREELRETRGHYSLDPPGKAEAS